MIKIMVNVQNVKNNPPEIKIIKPANGSIVKGSIIIKGKAWDKDGNDTLVKVEIRIDGKEWKEVEGKIEWAYSLDTKQLTNGKHKIEARSYDGIAYSKIISIEISVQNKVKKLPATLIAAIIIAIAAVIATIFLLIRKK